MENKMQIDDCSLMAKNLFTNAGLPYFNLCYFNMPKPLGFCYRNWIGLSTDFVLMNDAAEIEITLRHEIAHGWAGPGHEKDWRLEARFWGVDPDGKRHLDWGFKKLDAAFRSIPGMVAAGEHYFVKMMDEISRRADAGIKGTLDTRSFSRPPLILQSRV